MTRVRIDVVRERDRFGDHRVWRVWRGARIVAWLGTRAAARAEVRLVRRAAA